MATSSNPDPEKAWAEELENGAVQTAEIVIQRRLLADGQDAWRATFTNTMNGDLMPLVEIMGLLELAKDEAKEQHSTCTCGDCDDEGDKD